MINSIFEVFASIVVFLFISPAIIIGSLFGNNFNRPGSYGPNVGATDFGIAILFWLVVCLIIYLFYKRINRNKVS